jgi:acetate---CoA ligase (ADP-forming)
VSAGHPLDRLLAPRSIAIVGASDNPSGMSGFSLRNLIATGFRGGLYPVNPNRETVQGLPAVASVTALPETPDTALIVMPAARVLTALEECHQKGIPTATVVSSGFGEGDAGPEGLARKRELDEFIARSGMRVLGPNCIGPMNVTDSVIQRAAAYLPADLYPGPVTLISQSGGASLITLNRAQTHGVGLDLVLPTGNEADIGMTELFEYVIDRGTSQVVCLFVESVRDGERFIRVAERARVAGVHVVAVKVGVSSRGAEAVAAHTAALAGQDAAYDAIFRRLGIHRVRDYDGLHEVAGILQRHGPLRGRRLGAVCISGAEAAWIADRCGELDLDLPAPSAETGQALAGRLQYGAVENPLDLTGQLFSGDRGLAASALKAVCSDPAFDAVLVSVTSLGIDVATWLGPLLADAQRDSDTPLFVSWWLAGERTQLAHDHLRELGLTVFDGTYRALDAIASVAPARSGWPRDRFADGPSDEPGSLPSRTGAAAAAQLEGIVPFVPGELVETAEEALAASARVGYPVVLKLAADGVAHKTERGGVIVGIDSDEAMRAAFVRLTSVLPPPFELQQMITGGLELLVGAARDEVFGPMLTIGLGGVWTEILRDSVTEAAPVDAAAVIAMLQRLKAAPILAGYRGEPPYDVASVADIASRLGSWMVANPQVRAVELNPLIVRADSAVAVDALIELNPS